MTETTPPLFSGRARVAFCQGLGDSWRNLALCLEIPAAEQNRFDKGDEGRQIPFSYGIYRSFLKKSWSPLNTS